MSATARATPRVPAAKAGFSKTPMGPFQTMVRAPRRAVANWVTFAPDGKTVYVSNAGLRSVTLPQAMRPGTAERGA